MPGAQKISTLGSKNQGFQSPTNQKRVKWKISCNETNNDYLFKEERETEIVSKLLTSLLGCPLKRGVDTFA